MTLALWPGAGRVALRARGEGAPRLTRKMEVRGALPADAGPDARGDAGPGTGSDSAAASEAAPSMPAPLELLRREGPRAGRAGRSLRSPDVRTRLWARRARVSSSRRGGVGVRSRGWLRGGRGGGDEWL